MSLAYRKNKNTDLFRDLESHVGVHHAQNFVPLYTRFFALNASNWNHVTLDNANELVGIKGELDGKFLCTVKDSSGVRDTPVFFKQCPLVDPTKYLTGAYENHDLALPKLEGVTHPKLDEKNNSAYVDSFFYYLSSRLRQKGFVHGLEFYGSYLGEKHGFQYNLEDEATFCMNCSFFEKNNKKLFSVNVDAPEREKLNFGDDVELEFDELDGECSIPVPESEMSEVNISVPNDSLHIRGHSICSSNSSNTEEGLEVEDVEGEEYESEGSFSGEGLVATIEKFPIQLVAMEACEGTLDSLLRHVSPSQLTSALMQVILTLVAYNQIFQFTHNDLHTNNIMYVSTEKEYLYYQYKGTSYRVPTYGRIFKLIDFGRSIYTFSDRRFVSDSFAHDGDASSQYNIEPFFNPNKEMLDANYSFDLCRLACSMLDTLPDSDDFKELNELVEEWCQDDKKRNVVYKQNGDERYPCFKLYKMIARTVHAHTADAQLKRAMFQQYVVKKKMLKDKMVMNLDELKG
jgi:hypothetical protein